MDATDDASDTAQREKSGAQTEQSQIKFTYFFVLERTQTSRRQSDPSSKKKIFLSRTLKREYVSRFSLGFSLLKT